MIELLRKSIYSPEFYASLVHKPLSFSLQYFFSFILALALALTVIFSFTLIPRVNLFLRNVSPRVAANFPEDFVITIKDGEASTNASEPYALVLPDVLRVSGSVPVNFLVVDTESPAPLERFLEYDTVILLAKRHVVFRTDPEKNSFTAEALSQFPDTTITKELLTALSAQLPSLMRYFGPLMVFGLFFLFLAILGFKLAYLFVGAFLILGLMKLWKIKMGYKKAYQIGIHAMTLSILVTVLLFVMMPSVRIPLLFTAIMLGAVAVNFKKPNSAAPKSIPIPTNIA